MDSGRFNGEVRPYLIEFPIGIQGIGFDRLELDAWVDDYSRPQRASRTIERRHVMGRKKVPGLVIRGNLWHVDKVVFGRRICQSTGTARLEDAEGMLAKVMEEARLAQTARHTACSYVRAGCSQICAGEPTQAHSC